jgi:sortase (surface protein transpeptidase)
VRRLLTPGLVVPLLLAVVGAVLIIAGQLNLDQGSTGSSLPPIGEPTRTPSLQPTAVPSLPSLEPTPSVSPTPSPTPDPSWVATQLQITSIGLNIKVHKATTAAQCGFPPEYDAWILCGAQEPGRGGNAYIFAHARRGMFLPLWNVQLGAEIKVLMSDGQVLVYRVTEIHPNVSCPDTREPKMPANLEPLALRYAAPGCSQGVFWTSPADHERLTLQTSQGFNRNWGEFIVVADPVS